MSAEEQVLKIKSTATMIDAVTPTMRKIIDSVSDTVNAMEQLNTSSKDVFSDDMTRGARESIEQAKIALQEVEKQTVDNKKAQEEHNEALNKGDGHANKLLGTVKRMAAAYLSIQSVKKVFDMSDTLARNTARLNQMKREGESLKEVQEKIYASALRSNADYNQMLDVTTKMGIQASNAFNSTDEVVAFNEQLYKRFMIEGTDPTGQESVIYNLTQAMAQGVLRGQDLNAVLANTPSIAQETAKYLGEPIEKVRELAEQGKLSAETLKNAMLSSADEINEKYAQMPWTLAGLGTTLKTMINKELEPAMAKLNELINTEKFRNFATSIAKGAGVLMNILTEVISLAVQGASWIGEHWSIIAPILFGVTTAFVIMNNPIKLVIQSISSLNLVMLSSPWFWVIAAIGGIIFLLYKWIKAVGGVQVAWLILQNNLKIIIDKMQYNLQSGLGQAYVSWLNFKMGLDKVWSGIANGVGKMVSWVLDKIQYMANTAIGIVNNLIRAINSAFDTTVSEISSTEFAANFEVNRQAAEETRGYNLSFQQANIEREQRNLANRLNSLRQQQLGNEAQRSFEIADLQREARNSANNQLGAFDIGSWTDILPDLGNLGTGGVGTGAGSLPSNINDIKGNTGKLAKNTDNIEKELKRSNESLGLLKALAESRAITKFSLDKIDIKMENKFGDVNEKVDLDGYFNGVIDDLKEAVETSIGGAMA